jgi:hypothetical protein
MQQCFLVLYTTNFGFLISESIDYQRIPKSEISWVYMCLIKIMLLNLHYLKNSLPLRC